MNAGMAQSVERTPRKGEVTSSILVASWPFRFLLQLILKWLQGQINKELQRKKLNFKNKLAELNELKDLNIQRED